MRSAKALLCLLLSGVVLVALPTAASAHDPIFVEDTQTTPETGPYMPDGTISWALYGRVLSPGDTRGFEFDLKEGDELFVSLLIPNLEPEISLSDEELPTLTVTSPSGEEQEFVPDMREVFDEPFSKTSYVTLLEHREPAEAGLYKAVVVGNAPARFSAVIGETEEFFTESERSGDRPTSFPEISAPLQAWYNTPAGADAPVTTDADADSDAGEIQMDKIDEAVESGDVASNAEAESTTSDEEAEATAAEATPTESASDGESATAQDESSETTDSNSGGSALWFIAPVAVLAIAGIAYLVRRSSKT